MSYNRNCKWFSMEYVGNPGAVPACNQKGTLELFDCASCPENPVNKKRTNADRIRAMTDEELAEWINKHDCHTNLYGYDHKDAVIDWLKQEAE